MKQLLRCLKLLIMCKKKANSLYNSVILQTVILNTKKLIILALKRVSKMNAISRLSRFFLVNPLKA
ncbi:unnamed protein product [Schistosoma mansoni]|uniref:Smp_204690 n=1 Tax=Schistosoma mansoni TaxID=6183 RepID=G4LZA2_SCHMA|nr:unnamed protein product [Schistosoma mansoni]|eukprot:XP_018646577.1 unnamed protein product [Schistosoma mansoni]